MDSKARKLNSGADSKARKGAKLRPLLPCDGEWPHLVLEPSFTFLTGAEKETYESY
jgi:hypothetical protein